MASRFPTDNQVELRARKGHDMTWSCDKHGEPIKFYCKKHEIPICLPCATKDHGQKPCKLEDIEDVILEMKRKLEDKVEEIKKTETLLQTLDTKIKSSATCTSNHFQSFSDEVNASYEGKLKTVKDKEQKKMRLINKEADEEIRVINEKREILIKVCNEEAAQQQQILKESQAKNMSETKTISGVFAKKIEDLKSKHQQAVDTMDNISCKITRIKQDDKTLVNEAPQVIASLDESLRANVHQDVVDCLDRIQGEVQRVKFVEGKVGGEHYARIDGYIGKWELVKSIDIPSIVKHPCVRSLICDDKICVVDSSDSACYVTCLSSEHTEKVIEGDSNMGITSCASIDSNVIACGKWRGDETGDSLDGNITLYDRQWNVITDIMIQRNNPYYTEVYVDVDIDGMIIAVPDLGSNIYAINPDIGMIVNSFKMQGKKVWGGIHALSSGDIVAQTGMKEYMIISRSGEKKAFIHCDEWGMSWCRVDKLTDTLYITYLDRGRGDIMYAVDQVSCDGNIQARRIIEYVDSDRSDSHSPCHVTPSGNLVACDGDKLLVYKKRFSV